MYAKLDDELFDHPKLSAAGQILGKSGIGIALGFYTAGLLYTNRHLTDGMLTAAVISSWTNRFEKPLAVADALAKAGLFDKVEGGFRIHDYHEYNPSATAIKKKRREDRDRKRREREAKHGH